MIGTELGNAHGLEGARGASPRCSRRSCRRRCSRSTRKEVVDAFCAGRLGRDGGKAFGTLPGSVECATIIERARLRA